MPKNNSEWHSGRHVVYKLHVHLVFVTKYRRGAIAPDLHDVLREVFTSVCEDFGAELLEYGGADDHNGAPPRAMLDPALNDGVCASPLIKFAQDVSAATGDPGKLVSVIDSVDSRIEAALR